MDQGPVDLPRAVFGVLVQLGRYPQKAELADWLVSRMMRSANQAGITRASPRLLLGLVAQAALVFLPVSGMGAERSSIAEDLERIILDADAVGRDGYVDLEIQRNDVSVTVQLIAQDPDSYVLIQAVRAPDGTLVYINTGDADDDDDGVVSSEMSDSVYGNYGDTAFYLPLTPRHPLAVGTYRVFIDLGENAPLQRATVLFKTAPTNIDQSSQTLDLNVWLAHGDAAMTDRAFTTHIDQRFREVFDGVLQPHRLSVGEVEVYVADVEERAAYAVIDEHDDEQIANACRAMMSRVDGLRALNVVYVETLVSEEGGSAGFSPVPGTILEREATNACVFVGDTAFVVAPEEGFEQFMVDELHAATVLHEGGHFMSLEHPSEITGDNFDHIDDTPECDVATYDGRNDKWTGEPGVRDGDVTDYECGFDGGADNILFYSGVIEFAPFTLSPDQAWVLRRHPLFVTVQPELEN